MAATAATQLYIPAFYMTFTSESWPVVSTFTIIMLIFYVCNTIQPVVSKRSRDNPKLLA